jgi:hypothetical protein
MVASLGTLSAVIRVDEGASVKPVGCCIWTLISFAERFWALREDSRYVSIDIITIHLKVSPERADCRK